MAEAGRINKGDMLDPQEVKNFEALLLAVQKGTISFNELINSMKRLKTEFAGVNDVSKLVTINKELATSVSNLNKEQAKMTVLQKEKLKQEQALEKAIIQKNLAQSEENKLIQKTKLETQELNKAVRDKIKADQKNEQQMKNAKGSYNALQAEISENIKKYKALGNVMGQNAAQGKKLQQTILGQQNQLKKMDAQMGLHQKNVGNYRSALGGLRGALGGLGIALGGAMVIGKGFKEFLNSSQSTSDAFEQSIQGAKAGVDSFFKMLNRGDFSDFLGNMRDAIQAGRDFAATMDMLEDFNRSYEVAASEANISEQKLITTYRDKTKTKTERLDAAKKVENYERKAANFRVAAAEVELDSKIKLLSATTQLSEDQIKMYIREYGSLNDLIKTGEKYRSLQFDLAMAKDNGRVLNRGIIKDIEAEITAMGKYGEAAGKAATLFALASSEELNAVAEAIKKVNAEKASQDEILRKNTLTQASLEQEIADDKAKADEEAAKAAEEARKKNQEFRESISIYGKLNAEIERYNQLIKESQDSEEIKFLKIRIAQLEAQLKNIQDYGAELKKLKPELESTIFSEQANKAVQKLSTTLAEMPRNAEVAADKTVTALDKLKELEGLTFAEILGWSEEEIGAVKDRLNAFVGEIQTALQNSLDFDMSLNDAKVELHEKEIDDLSTKLEDERSLQEQGKANNADLIRTQLENEQVLRDKALADREKLEARQRKLDTLSEFSSMSTTSANILKGWSTVPFVGQVLGIAAIATMWGSFLALKAKMKAATKNQYAEGVFDFRGEGSETSDDNLAFISDHESIVHAKGTKRAPVALKGIIEQGWTDEDLGLKSKFLTSKQMFQLNMPNVPYRKEYVDTIGQLKEDMKKNVKATENLLNFFLADEKIIFHPVTGEMIKKYKNGIKVYKGDYKKYLNA
jgi:hypothetical protein